jgi:predicted CXXCH cytochrome family protein
VVFRDRDLLADIPSASNGYLGYSNTEEKLTVCGNCHIGQQTDWVTTAHADAWATLEANPGKQALCEGCHTVSEAGNKIETASVGWTATQDERFHDVQCESCHGPGLQHVQNPGATQPLASLGVTIAGTNGCGECHSGVHHPFVEEWAESGHGRVEASPSTRPECIGCHTGQGALAAMGANDAEYEEKASATPLPIACAVCHDPHGSGNDRQLRFAIDVPDEAQNLCMRCHHKRALPDFASPQRGPHSPEGPLLLGEAGWWPPNMPIEPGSILGTHGSTANPRLCAGCHVYQYQVTDKQTGAFLVAVTGHRFEATPCVNAQGAPTGEDECTRAERSYISCTASGCHGSQNAARSAHTTAELRLTNLATQLNAQLAKVPSSEFSTTDNRYSTAEGARFNAQLGLMSGTAVHNPFLAEALLIGSIAQVQKDYGVTPSAGLDLTVRLRPPEGHP